MNDYVYFAFIDVLGYRNFLDADINNNTLTFKDQLQAAFEVFNEVNGAQFPHKSISDSIFLNSSAEDPIEFFKLLKKIFVSFIQKGILIRGGVSYNRHFENHAITYSLALTEAYKLESSAAIFPRILIHQSIIEKLRNQHQAGGSHLSTIINEGLLLQDGKSTQLHVIDENNWNDLYLGCKNIYQKNSSSIDADNQLRLKHTWLQNYLFSYRPSGSRKARYIQEFLPFQL